MRRARAVRRDITEGFCLLPYCNDRMGIMGVDENYGRLVGVMGIMGMMGVMGVMGII